MTQLRETIFTEIIHPKWFIVLLNDTITFGWWRDAEMVSNKPTRSTQPCIPPGSLNRVQASAGVKAGMSPLPGVIPYGT